MVGFCDGGVTGLRVVGCKRTLHKARCIHTPASLVALHLSRALILVANVCGPDAGRHNLAVLEQITQHGVGVAAADKLLHEHNHTTQHSMRPTVSSRKAAAKQRPHCLFPHNITRKQHIHCTGHNCYPNRMCHAVLYRAMPCHAYALCAHLWYECLHAVVLQDHLHLAVTNPHNLALNKTTKLQQVQQQQQ